MSKGASADTFGVCSSTDLDMVAMGSVERAADAGDKSLRVGEVSTMSLFFRQVPVTGRLLAARPARTVAGIMGIGLALMLMLLLNGLWTGVQRSVTVYDDRPRRRPGRRAARYTEPVR